MTSIIPGITQDQEERLFSYLKNPLSTAIVEETRKVEEG
jgi:hypothetical protein